MENLTNKNEVKIKFHQRKLNKLKKLGYKNVHDYQHILYHTEQIQILKQTI